MKAKVLIVEDDTEVQDYLTSYLIEQGFMVKSCVKGAQVMPTIDSFEPDIVLLDLQLPDMKGESVARSVKEDYPDLPIIMLTAKSHVYDKISGFKAGADDYVTKPFEPDELVVRIQARLKDKINTTTTLQVGDLVLDTKTVTVKRGDKEIALSPQEFRLLEYLMANKNIVLSRDKILSRVWSVAADIETRVVDVYMGYLRKKIDAPFNKKLIHSVRGFGYVLKEPQEEV